LSTNIVRASHLVYFSLPFPVRDVFADPRELLISGVGDLPAVLPLVSRTRISQSWNVDQCVLMGKKLMLPRTDAYLPVLTVRNLGLPAVVFRSVLRWNDGKTASVFFTAAMGTYNVRVHRMVAAAVAFRSVLLLNDGKTASVFLTAAKGTYYVRVHRMVAAAVAFRSVLRLNDGKTASVFLTAAKGTYYVRVHRMVAAAVAFRSVLRRNDGKTASVFLTAAMEK